MNRFRFLILGCAAGVTLSSHACTIVEFGAENLLNPAQNTPEIIFEELEAFAAGLFSTRPIFTGSEPHFETDLNQPIDLAGAGYAVVHYAAGSSGNPILNKGGSIVFYYLQPDSCSFIFPQTGLGNNFSNGPITSVTLFFSETIPDTGTTVILFAVALGIIGMFLRFAKQQQIAKAAKEYAFGESRKSTALVRIADSRSRVRAQSP